MDIELSLRELLVLRDPGARFTDGVMSRVGDAPVGQQRDDVVQLVDARARRRSRRILLVTVIAVVAAAAVPTLVLRDQAEPSAVQDPALQTASALTVAASSPPVEAEAQPDEPGNSPDPLECLDDDVVRGLLLQSASSHRFSVAADLPPELAAFKAPRQLTPVGSSERTFSGNGGRSSVAMVYRSSLTPDAARAAGAKALTASGWSPNSGSGFAMINVFRSGSSNPIGETWCREGKPVSISASAMDGVTYLILSLTRNPGGGANSGNACDQPVQPVRVTSLLDGYMPTLDLPRDPVTGQQVAMRGGGGSNGNVKRSTSVSFTLNGSVGNVAQHFAGQMAQQGWSNEANWNGTASAGSTWTRRADAETLLQGNLVVSAFDGGNFTVAFNVVQTK